MSVRRWPASLPPLSYEGASVSPVEQSIRTDMEVGERRLRRITAVRRSRVNAAWVFTNTEMGGFRAWFGDEAWSLAGDSDDLTGWTADGVSTVADAVTGPDGQTLTLLTEDTSTGYHFVTLDIASGLTSGGTGYMAATVKANGAAQSRVRLRNRDGVLCYVIIDLTDGTVDASGGILTSTVTPLGDDFWRVEITFDIGTGGTTPQAEVGIVSGGAASYTGGGSDGIYAGEVNVRLADGYDQFLPVGSDGNATGAAGGSAWFLLAVPLGGAPALREVRFGGEWSATPASGLRWTVTAPLEVRDA